MPYGQYENTSFNGQTFTLGNVGLTGATGPNLVSSDATKPVRVNGIVPTAGGGGGGDVFTNNDNTYDVGIVNTFRGNTILTTAEATGKITCVALDAGNGKIETLADVECQGLNAGAVKIETTANVDCAGLVATADVQCVGVVASGTVSGATLTSSGDVNCVGLSATTVTTSGDVNTGSGNIISGGSITAGSMSTNSGGSITSAGDVVATSGTGIIHGKSILSDTNISCGAGGNYFVGAARLASSNLIDGSLLLNTSGTQQTKTGNLIVSQLSTSAGVLNFDTTGGANIQNNTGTNTLTTSTTNISDTLNWRLGTAGNDSLRLRYDANGGGSGIPRYFLEMLDPSTSPASYFQLSGNSGYDVTGLIALINNSSLTFNATTITTFNGQIFYPQPTFTTFAAGGFYTGAPTTFIDTVSRFPVGILTETYGTTSKITMRGCCQLRAGGTIAANTTIASIPVGARPSVDVVVAVQGQTGSEQGRVDFLANGNVEFIGPDATFTQINFSQISYFLV